MREPRLTRADLATGLVLGALALLLALHNLGHGSLEWWDEGLSAERARQMLHHPSLFTQCNGVPILTKPPLYYALAALSANWFGLDEFAVRLPSALFGAGGVLAVFAVARAASGSRTLAVIAAMLLLGNPHWINMARQARLESATGVSMLITLHLAGRAVDRGRDGWWLALEAGVVAGLGALFKNPLTLLALLAARPWRGGAQRLGWCALGFAIGGGWWFALAWATLPHRFVSEVLGYDTFLRLLTPLEGHSGNLLFYNNTIYRLARLPYAAFLATLVYLLWVRRVPRWLAPHLLFVSTWLLLLHVAQTRLHWYLVPAYPSLAIVGAAGLSELLSRLRLPRIRIAAVAALALGLSLFAFGRHGYDLELDFAPESKAFARRCADQLAAGDEVICLLDFSWIYAFYLDRDLVLVPEPPDRVGVLVMAAVERAPGLATGRQAERVAAGDGVVLLRLREE